MGTTCSEGIDGAAERVGPRGRVWSEEVYRAAREGCGPAEVAVRIPVAPDDAAERRAAGPVGPPPSAQDRARPMQMS